MAAAAIGGIEAPFLIGRRVEEEQASAGWQNEVRLKPGRLAEFDLEQEVERLPVETWPFEMLRHQGQAAEMRLAPAACLRQKSDCGTRERRYPVVQGVSEDRYAIGYSGAGYRTSGVRAVPLAEAEAGPFYEGTYDEVTTGKYPLSRFLYVYINKPNGKPLDPLQLEFLKLMLSKEGQEVVVKDGYMPLMPKQVEEELAKVVK